MDFAPSDRVTELRARVRAYMDEHVMPVERQAVQALDEEVRPGVAYPERAPAVRPGLSTLRHATAATLARLGLGARRGSTIRARNSPV